MSKNPSHNADDLRFNVYYLFVNKTKYCNIMSLVVRRGHGGILG